MFAMSGEHPSANRGQAIWLRPERAARGPVPEHSRAEIAAAAVVLADARGLAAVTMRSVAAAIGTAPASLYRYVTSREELVELLADRVYGEISPGGGAGSGDVLTDLLRLGHQSLGVYLRHPWLLEVATTGNLPGPNALAFTESALAALAPAALSGPAKLESIGLFSGAVRLLAQAELEQRRAGQDIARWQGSLAGYLTLVAADGRHPHLAAALDDALAGQAAVPAPDQEPLFDRAMRRILAGLLQPEVTGKRS
jgi:AcrR family transcriptional regulator